MQLWDTMHMLSKHRQVTVMLSAGLHTVDGKRGNVDVLYLKLGVLCISSFVEQQKEFWPKSKGYTA